MNAHDKTVQQSKTCYTCEKLNHFFRDCTQNKYKNKSKLYNKQDRSFAAIKENQKDKCHGLRAGWNQDGILITRF